MFKHYLAGRPGLFVGILVLAGACEGGEIGDFSGEPRLGPGANDIEGGIGETPPGGVPGEPDTPGTPSEPTCPGGSPDVAASNGWLSSEASAPAFDALYFEFKARPGAANLDGLMAVGAEDINDFTKAAIAVRFAQNGRVDVRDGAFYSSDMSYAYDPGVWYNVAVSADIASKTYDVEIGPCGEPRETLIKSASFRDDAEVSGELNTWAVWSSQAAALELSTPTWMPSGGCAPATCQSLGHECGQPGNGCGGSLNCGACGSGETCTSGLCVTSSTPPPPPEPTPPPPEPTPPPVSPPPAGGGVDPAGRGPTGQWPPGFPAYSTPADIVTNGSSSGLSSALSSGTCSSGCVIEHPGNIPAMTLTRSGSGEIVVRPPIGQRANYVITGKANIRSSNLLIAGFGATSTMLVSSGSNSGFAWIENSNGSGQVAVYGNGGDVASGIFYEILYRRFSAPGLGDRGGIRAGGGGYANMLVVGSVLTGDPSEPPAHADTLQSYYDSGAGGLITVRDSVVWPSWDKAYQGEGNTLAFVNDNVWIASPSNATKLWPGPGSINFGQPFHTTATAEYRNSTIIGPGHPDTSIRVWDSELFEFPSAIDMGGNAVLTQRAAPPPVPTHEQLDAIWSP